MAAFGGEPARPTKRSRIERLGLGSAGIVSDIPIVDATADGDIPYEEFLKKYKEFQVVLCKGCVDAAKFSLSVLDGIYSKAPDHIKDTFTLENLGSGGLGDKDQPKWTEGDKWYASFIVQKDPVLMNHIFNKAVPFKALVWAKQATIHHSEVVWFFCGKNLHELDLTGRTEHTDSVTHDGTWHAQVSGEKLWSIRPTEELIKMCGEKTGMTVDSKFTIRCARGDLLLINTRLWWHQTRIPCTKLANDKVSISYARDIYFDAPARGKDLTDMTNIDGLYAPKNITEGSVVLTEDQLPDCTLPRSEAPNCQVVELDDGSGALVALRDIKEGEFFSVCPSSSEEDGDGGEWEETEEDDYKASQLD